MLLGVGAGGAVAEVWTEEDGMAVVFDGAVVIAGANDGGSS